MAKTRHLSSKYHCIFVGVILCQMPKLSIYICVILFPQKTLHWSFISLSPSWKYSMLCHLGKPSQLYLGTAINLLLISLPRLCPSKSSLSIIRVYAIEAWLLSLVTVFKISLKVLNPLEFFWTPDNQLTRFLKILNIYFNSSYWFFFSLLIWVRIKKQD